MTGFARAVDLLERVTGRVVVSGMGKSGHVARKIAATLASTGTPALFVHPAEASHGDLGMIVAGDAVLALSNSGETAELADLVEHTRRFALPLVVISARAGSTLANAADVALILPPPPRPAPWAWRRPPPPPCKWRSATRLRSRCSIRRGFTPADFTPLPPWRHAGFPAPPGARAYARRRRNAAGGARHADGPRAAADDRKALRLPRRLGADGRLAGIVTDGDLRRAMGPDLLARRLGDIMTPSPRTIGPDALAAEALHVMNAGPSDHRPVRRGRRPPPRRHPAHPRPVARGAGMSLHPVTTMTTQRSPGAKLVVAAAARIRRLPNSRHLARRHILITLAKFVPAGARPAAAGQHRALAGFRPRQGTGHLCIPARQQ